MSREAPEFVDLLANVAHDIKNSLSLVLSAAETLELVPDLPPAAREALLDVQHQCRRAASDLLHLLGAFKLERGRPLVAPMPVDCEELLAEVAAYHRELLAGKGIELRVRACEVDTWTFDRGLVLGVLNATLLNAFRHARNLITLDCSVRDRFVVFSVEDDGPGYPPALLAQGESLQPAHALDSTGLGLYFARRIAALHRREDRTGRVELANRPGGCFELWLP